MRRFFVGGRVKKFPGSLPLAMTPSKFPYTGDSILRWSERCAFHVFLHLKSQSVDPNATTANGGGRCDDVSRRDKVTLPALTSLSRVLIVVAHLAGQGLPGWRRHLRFPCSVGPSSEMNRRDLVSMHHSVESRICSGAEGSSCLCPAAGEGNPTYIYIEATIIKRICFMI